MVAISSDGFARLVRVRAGEYVALAPWRQYGAIQRGIGATNRLRLVAQGANLVASVNGVQVITATDAIDVGGQLTLGVHTSDAGGATVAFEAVSGTVGALALDESFDDPAAVRWSVGGGLRFVVSETERVSARVDAGYGSGDWGIYFNVTEAF